MCRPNDFRTTISEPSLDRKTPSRQSTTTSSWLWSALRVTVVLWPMLTQPTYCFLNRGYTQWFHWNAVLYMTITRPCRWHAEFLALQGLTVTLGWYASLCYDGLMHGRFAHILYWNMPARMTVYMLSPDDASIVYNAVSIAVMGLAHALDTLGHPVLAYYFWKQSTPPRDINNNNNTETSIFARFSWSTLICSYLLSRVWSITHTWYNHGKPSLFYFGYDVYTILDRDCWMAGLWLPAYITEGVVYVVWVLGKLWVERQSTTTTTTATNNKSISLDRVPSALLQSTVSEDEFFDKED